MNQENYDSGGKCSTCFISLLIIEIEEQKQIMQLVGRNKISVMSQLSQKNGSVEERKLLGNDSHSTMRMQTNFSK